jgi:hypothetical protein
MIPQFKDDALDAKMCGLLSHSIAPSLYGKLARAILTQLVSSSTFLAVGKLEASLTGAAPASPLRPPTDPIVTMVPAFFSRKCGNTAFVTFTTPKKFVSNCVAYVSWL